MNNNAWALVRAIRGPILLMTLGILFAVDQNGGYGFGRTWPVLFILFGVLKLAERLLIPPQPPYPQAPWQEPGQWTQQPPPPQGGMQP